jgi:two-component system sensor histidine kinase GlrK
VTNKVFFPRPKSFLKLVLLGFGLVALPLVAALTYAIVYVDKLADHSQYTVYQAAESTQKSRMLVEQVTGLERAARQYQVLGDLALFKAYQGLRDDFQRTIKDMLTLPLETSFRKHLLTLSGTEDRVYETLRNSAYNSTKSKQAVALFLGMSEQARQMVSGSHNMINREVGVMNDMAERARSSFFWFGLALIPALILIVIGSMIVISRPIRQIDQAIRTLGDGQFDQPIEVAGPRDLELLGKRLEWLRLRLAEVEQEKVKFLRHVSHELKTPLTALREGADLLADGVLGKLRPDQQEVMRILSSNTAQLQNLIEDLLNFSIAHRKEAVLQREYVNLDNLVRRVIKDQKLAIIAKQIQLKLDVEPVAVNGDKEKLRVVLDNLLSNAVKFSPKKGTVGIFIKLKGEDAAIDIIDKGPGIQEWEKERIFEAFYQGQAKAEGHIKGTGLGLSIVRDYIEAHGGGVEVNSKSRHGAHLSLRLPTGITQEAV